MSAAHFVAIILALLPCLIPPYAFRLSRVFGTKRVGWMVFAVFALLAAMQLVRAFVLVGWLDNPSLTLDILYFVVPVLLLIGMVHLETLFKERLRLEQEQRQLRAKLEVQVKTRTAELDQVNEDLQREISLRKQGEEELRKSKEQYRFLFEENPESMWIFDLETLRFLAFNSAALRRYGYPAAEFRELSAPELCVPEQAQPFLADCAKTGYGVQHRGTWKHRKKDGSPLEVEITSLDLTYTSRPARLVLAHDITAQRQLQKQLLQTQRMQVTNQLAGGVADNFNTLITTIEEDARSLAQNCQEAASAEPLKRIAATAASAGGLTRQLLALVRRHPMQVQSLDLNQLIDQQSGALSALLGKKISLETICRANLPAMTADPALVEQILRNLVLNARDAMPNGGTVTISTAPVRLEESDVRYQEDSRPGTFVCLTVEDSGCGISPDIQEHLFEPFFTTKTSGSATGLGLATVRGLARQHSGWVEVESTPGSGSRFKVFFPCGLVASSSKVR
ncbi:MAG TPA: ATP-binding protein [Candidatus Limnocylindrales bacterium]|jgi:PAS domain S-box-containing protein|nr:ATP-binding protein [Candidatus Limnocylindrales bacterium]